MTMIEIKKYDVAYYAGGKNAAGYPYRAIIGLRNEEDGLIGAAYFHHNASTLPVSRTEDVHEWFEEVHKWLAYAGLALIALHVAGALKHHFDGHRLRRLPDAARPHRRGARRLFDGDVPGARAADLDSVRRLCLDAVCYRRPGAGRARQRPGHWNRGEVNFTRFCSWTAGCSTAAAACSVAGFSASSTRISYFNRACCKRRSRARP